MIVRYILAALVAGLIAGVLATAAQQARVVPLILEAEKYEKAPAAEHEHMSGLRLDFASAAQAQEAAPVAAEEEDAGTLFGSGRLTGTLMANIVTGAGFALILLAAVLVTGQTITARTGAIWGICGWLVFQLSPAVGLPPELPGFPAAELGARQAWWVGCAMATAAALYLLILRGEIWAKVAGVVLMLVPHALGAPQPADIATDVPAILAAEYASAALATGLFFWVMIGLLVGIFNTRFGKAA